MPAGFAEAVREVAVWCRSAISTRKRAGKRGAGYAFIGGGQGINEGGVTWGMPGTNARGSPAVGRGNSPCSGIHVVLNKGFSDILVEDMDPISRGQESHCENINLNKSNNLIFFLNRMIPWFKKCFIEKITLDFF